MNGLASESSRVPLIYTRLDDASRLPLAHRAIAAVIALACITVLALAVHLTPSPEGVGTHTELGFSQCQFLQRTGLACPSCGMTTSFSWFVRGNFLASFYIQPMGFVLAILTTAIAWAGAYIALTGKAAHRLMRLIPYQRWLIPLMTFALLSWGWKMFIHLKGIDGWR